VSNKRAPDRPAAVDLDALEQLLDSATGGTWFERVGSTDVVDVHGYDFVRCDVAEDAAAIVALRNAAPDLFAELRAAREDMKAAAGELLVRMPEPGTDMARLLLANRMLMRERDRLRSIEALARAYREADQAKDAAGHLRRQLGAAFHEAQKSGGESMRSAGDEYDAAILADRDALAVMVEAREALDAALAPRTP